MGVGWGSHPRRRHADPHTSAQHHGSDTWLRGKHSPDIRLVLGLRAGRLQDTMSPAGRAGQGRAGQARTWLIEAPFMPTLPEAAAPSALARRQQHPRRLLTVGGEDTHVEGEGLLLASLLQVHGISLLNSHTTKSDINLQRGRPGGSKRQRQAAGARSALPRGWTERLRCRCHQPPAAGAALGRGSPQGPRQRCSLGERPSSNRSCKLSKTKAGQLWCRKHS